MVLRIRALFVALALAAAAVCFEPTAALNVKLHGVNYDLRRGPDWDSQRCKPSTVVTNDLKKLSQLTNRIRIYSLEDCNVRQVLRTAPTLNMTVWLGMWVSDKESVFRKEVSELKLLIRDDFISEDVVSAINVGSEALYRKETTGDVLIENFKTVKEILANAKLNISVSVTDTLGELVDNPDVIDAVDVISFNQFPFWNNISVDGAAADLEYAVESLSNSTKNKPFVIAETGWAAGGFDERASDATPENAAKFLKDFYMLAEEKEWKYYYFVGFDAPFLKTHNGSKDSVEAYFGLFNESGKLNSHYADLTIPAKKMLDGKFTPLETSAPKASTPSDSAATAVSITTVVAVFSAVVAALLA